MLALNKNPLTTWTRRHYEEPIVAGTTPLGKFAMISDPAGVREVLVDQADLYKKDELQGRLLKPALGNGLLTAGGDDWRRQRRVFAPLFAPRLVVSHLRAMGEAATGLVARWSHMRDGRPVNVAEELATAMLDVLARTLFVGGVGHSPHEFMTAATHYFETQGRIDPLDLVGAPDWIPRIGRILAQPALTFFPEVVAGVISDRRDALARNPAATPRDLVATLIEARDADTGAAMSDDEIAANIITFIGAGFETPCNALSWALYLLSIDEEWRARVEAEADRELGNGALLDAPGLELLTDTRAVLEEAMRLYPPVAIISRSALADHEIAGHVIRRGTTVIVAPWVIHRHRRLWHDPDSYDPTRFLSQRRCTIDRFAYIPFGAGPRVCIGASFAMQEMMVTLATIARSFRLDLVPGHKVEPVHRVTMRPEGGMMMTVRRRG